MNEETEKAVAVREAELSAECDEDMRLAAKGLYRNRVTGEVCPIPINEAVKQDIINYAINKCLDREHPEVEFRIPLN